MSYFMVKIVRHSDYSTSASSNIKSVSNLFVWARPKIMDWSEIDGTMFRVGREEYRPCMIVGNGSDARVQVIGSSFGFLLVHFDIVDEIRSPIAGYILTAAAVQGATPDKIIRP